jgi:hypothetical protein
MTGPPTTLDQMQATVEAVIREHNATADSWGIYIVWGYRDKETEAREKIYAGTDDEVRQGLLNLEGDDFEVFLVVGRPGRPGWLTICKSIETVLPLPSTPEALVGVLRDECAPTVKVDILPGGEENEGLLVAGSVSTAVFFEGLTARVLLTLLEDLRTSAVLVLERLEKEDEQGDPESRAGE